MTAPQLAELDVEELRETHISWVYLTATEAWKIKKPVDFGFLDFTTPELRRQACESEVALNSRLAPSVYLGVVGLSENSDGQLVSDEDAPSEWAVRMRRLPDAACADRQLDSLGADRIDALAACLARFHARARCDEHTARFGAVEVITDNVQENFAQAGAWPIRVIGLTRAIEIEAWQLDFIRTHAQDFSRRVEQGRVRDGHGDLRLEHIYFIDGEPVVIDCIEFNERFRYADVCADIAFLSMDLARQGRHDLAERLLARYAMESGDYDLYRLVDFYESYRAFVRGKLASFQLAERPDPATTVLARQYFLRALAARRPALIPPMVVAVGGIIASGKTTVADRLSLALDGAVVEADRTRKQMLDMAPTDSAAAGAWQGAYNPDFSAKVYDELLRRARRVAASGRPVVLDTSFRTAALRGRALQLAEDLDLPFWFVECRADPELCRRRLIARNNDDTASDATIDIFDDFLDRYEPPIELPADRVIALDTSGSVVDSVSELLNRILGDESALGR